MTYFSKFIFWTHNQCIISNYNDLRVIITILYEIERFILTKIADDLEKIGQGQI